jgi:TPP-dependent pyruvate/acetoin dehydrogenase alpha subunit
LPHNAEPPPAADAPSFTRDQVTWFYQRMVLIRTFEEQLYRLRESAVLQGSAHLSVGQEAVAVGVCSQLNRDDYVTTTHRGHGHCIAKGLDVRRMMAELYGRSSGTNRGKGGSMHLADVSLGVLGATGIVGAGIPIALGAALSARNRGTRQVAVAFFGDGTMGQGTVYECMNMAAIWRLPLLFACENNGYAEATPAEYALGVRDLADRTAGFGLPGVIVDGQDVFAVARATAPAVARARAGQGPTFLEFKTYRYYGHYFGDDPLRYRTKEEEEHFRARDCIRQFEQQTVDAGTLMREELREMDRWAERQIQEAVRFAETSPPPPRSEVVTDVHTPSGPKHVDG